MRKGKLMGKIFGIALACVLVGTMLPLGAFACQSQALAQEAIIWHVDDDLADYPDANFTTIQDAVDASSDGDAIVVYNGTYQEHVTLDKSVTLHTDAGAAIDGGGTLSTVTIIVDGCTVSGFNITGSGSHPHENAGVRVESDSNTVSDNTIAGNKEDGIVLCGRGNTVRNNLISGNKGSGLKCGAGHDAHNTVQGNTISGNSDYGIYLAGENNTLRDNTMDGNGCNFGIPYGIYNDVDTSNTVEGKPLHYILGEQNAVIDSDTNAGCVIAIDSRNITIRNLTFANNGVCLYGCHNCLVDNVTAQASHYGISLEECANSTVQNCRVSGNYRALSLERSYGNALCSNHIEDNHDGIVLRDSDANLMTDNTIQSNGDGIVLDTSYENVVESNKVLGNDGVGIYFEGSDANVITENTVQGNVVGMALEYSYDCTIEDNLVTQNEYTGVEIHGSCGHFIYRNTISENGWDGIMCRTGDNVIHHNNFIDNGRNAWTYEASSWDDGSEGNYWSDYEERYPDAEEVDGTGIWDTPYQISGDANDKDNYPLKEPSVAGLGDANKDGVVNMADVTKVERIILALDLPCIWADANQDGIINMADVTKIERIILGIDC